MNDTANGDYIVRDILGIYCIIYCIEKLYTVVYSGTQTEVCIHVTNM